MTDLDIDVQNIPFLSTIKANNRLYRKKTAGNKRCWENLQFTKPKEFKATFLGYRMLQNGTVYSDEGYGAYFVPDNHIKVALVVINGRENPFYVALEDIISTKGVK